DFGQILVENLVIQCFLIREDDQSFDDIDEFPDVARPVVCLQVVDQLLVGVFDACSVLFGQTVQIVEEQRFYIIRPFPERRYVDVDDINPVQKVGSEVIRGEEV